MLVKASPVFTALWTNYVEGLSMFNALHVFVCHSCSPMHSQWLSALVLIASTSAAGGGGQLFTMEGVLVAQPIVVRALGDALAK